MISNEAILQQLELKLQQAKLAGSEATMREALSAIRTLCDVVLDNPSTNEIANVATTMQQPVISQNFAQSVSPVPVVKTSTAPELEEANGHSIFDF